MKIGRNIALTFVCILLGLVLSWQLKSINYNEKIVYAENKRSDELKTELINEKQKNDLLRQKNEELIRLNSEYESVKNNEEGMTEKFSQEIQKLKTLAGLVDVKGKGIVVTVDNKGFNYVDDTQILDLVNELKASDAQAISVNEERIVALSEIREAGSHVMVNGTRMTAPYTVKAIGDPDKLFHSLKMTGGIIERLEIALKVNIDRSDNIIIPKVRDDGSVIKTNLLNPVK